MYLVQILLPLYDNQGRRLPRALFDHAARMLAKAHGGVTAYTRSPAVGLWNPGGSRVRRDDIVVYEIMTPALNLKLWARRRKAWEAGFRQESIVIRAARCRRL